MNRERCRIIDRESSPRMHLFQSSIIAPDSPSIKPRTSRALRPLALLFLVSQHSLAASPSFLLLFSVLCRLSRSSCQLCFPMFVALLPPRNASEKFFSHIRPNPQSSPVFFRYNFPRINHHSRDPVHEPPGALSRFR